MARNSLLKGFTDTNVYDATLDRIRYCYDHFDHVAVSFSGGKDSTVVLNMALEVARERGKLPLDVIFFDEEALPPPTVEYCERVRANPDLNFLWLCVQVKGRNGCSKRHPYWYSWDATCPEKWVRPLPEDCTTELPMPGYMFDHDESTGIELASYFLYPDNIGSIVLLTGIRTQESMRRYTAVTKRKHESWITTSPGVAMHRAPDGKVRNRKTNVFKAHPIYDWMVEDVWIAPGKFGWDYNRCYDVYERAGLARNKQRVCAPFGEEPMRMFWVWAECFPEMWQKMYGRVPGVGAAWRYANTELYGMDFEEALPERVESWQDYFYILLDYVPNVSDKRLMIDNANQLIAHHNKKTKSKIPDESPDIITGISWRFLCKLLVRGDYKGRKKTAAIGLSDGALRREGITLLDAALKYGTPAFAKKVRQDYGERNQNKAS